MTLDSLPDLDTSGLCLVKTLPTALTCWPYRNTALRDGARTSTRTSSVAKGRTASIHCRARDGDEWVVVGGPEGCTAARPSWLAGDGPVSLVPSARRPADEKLTVR